MTRGLLVVVVGVAVVLFSPQDHGFLQGQKEGQSGVPRPDVSLTYCGHLRNALRKSNKWMNKPILITIPSLLHLHSLGISSPPCALPDGFAWGLGEKITFVQDICMSLAANPSCTWVLRAAFQPGYGHRKFQNWPVKKKKEGFMPQNKNISCQLETNQPHFGPVGFSDPPKKARPMGVRAWQKTSWPVWRSTDASALVSLKMERILVPKYTWVFQNLLLPPPTFTLLTQGGKITHQQFIFLKDCCQAYIYFFTAELFLISVLAKSNTEQPWLGDIWKPCQVKQCLRVYIGSASLVKVYFNLTEKHLKTLVM